MKKERGNRIFPCSDKSQDVLNAFLKELKMLGVKIYTNSKVTKIITEEDKVKAVEYENNGTKKTIEAQKIVLATGGKSYPATGSTGDGYFLAKKLRT